MSTGEKNNPLEATAEGTAQETSSSTTPLSSSGPTQESTSGAGSSSSTPSVAPVVLSEEQVNKKFEDAKALFRADNYKAAADLFAEVLEAKVSMYGELALECADAYFMYGRSLLLSHKSETDVLGNAVKQQIEEEESDDDDAPPAAEEELEDAQPAQQEDADTAQVAWETLEVARVIYEKYPDCMLQLSNVHYSLAEFSLETDNILGAIEDFKKCIELREKCLPPHDRMLAEAHYSLGLSYYTTNLASAAHRHYSVACDIIESHIATLPPDSPDVADLKAVLADLVAKMDEVNPQLAEKPQAENGDQKDKGKDAQLPPKPQQAETKEIPKPRLTRLFFEENETTNPFDKPVLSSSAAPPVNDLGVVGKSARRVAPSSTSSTSSSSTSNAATVGDKRKLDLEGDEGGEKRQKAT
jgi:tetratricopeptide (TPR) repeat protein